MWSIVSSLLPHNLHLLFSCVFSIHALVWLVHIALFWAAIRRDSVSLLRFPFLSHVQVFSCKMLLISPSSYFSSHFGFLIIVVLLVLVLSVMFLVAIISLSSHFCMKSSSCCIDMSSLSSMLACPLPPSFLNTYCLSTSYLGYNAFCMVISFSFSHQR